MTLCDECQTSFPTINVVDVVYLLGPAINTTHTNNYGASDLSDN